MATGNGSSTATKKVETRQLPVKLTEKELLARGDELAACELKIEELKAEAAEVNRGVKNEQKQRKKLAHDIDRGTEDRDVECTWVEDFPKNVWRLKRNDDGKEVDTRPMTADDRTGSLFAKDDDSSLGVPPPRKPKKAAAAKPRAKKDNVRHINA